MEVSIAVVMQRDLASYSAVRKLLGDSHPRLPYPWYDVSDRWLILSHVLSRCTKLSDIDHSSGDAIHHVAVSPSRSCLDSENSAVSQKKYF
jgi:hypothetical protein